MPTLLAFDTSTIACSVAILRNGDCHQEMQIKPQQHAELLLPMISSLCMRIQCPLSHLDAIAFGHGPGSFIGVRLATAVAQALGFAARLPLIPVCSLQALAQEASMRHAKTQIVATWDARMGEIYWGLYTVDVHQQIPQPRLTARLTSPEELVTTLMPYHQQSLLLVGNAWTVYEQALASILDYNDVQVDTTLYPTAEAVARLAHVFYDAGQSVTAVHAQPFYLRQQVATQPT